MASPKKKKKKGASELHILTPLQIFDSKFKIPIATEIRQFFRHLGNQHLTAHQTAQW